jgi:hypothetical protein
MRKSFYVAAAVLGLWQSAHAADVVTIQQKIPYNEDAEIAASVKHECLLDEHLAEYVVKYSSARGVKVETAPEVASGGAGRVLVMEITGAVSDGNAFMGHHKSMSVKGKLYQDGQLAASFKARRVTMGGAFAGFKGNCSVLDRANQALGEDIAGWLAQPKMDAMLGDLE